MAFIFAKRQNYEINANQEFFALVSEDVEKLFFKTNLLFFFRV
jgi:hypothetical protein